MTTDDICIIDLDLAPIEGDRDPSVEAPLHAAVYKNRRDVNAVVHSHQIYASIFSILNEPIPPLFDEVTVAIGSMVEVVPYGVSGSPQLLENVVSKLDNRCHCYLLQNHGALCMGRDLEKTVNYVELLEKTASIYYRALATGKPVTTLPDPLPDVLFEFVKRKQDEEIARKDGRHSPSERPRAPHEEAHAEWQVRSRDRPGNLGLQGRPGVGSWPGRRLVLSRRGHPDPAWGRRRAGPR